MNTKQNIIEIAEIALGVLTTALLFLAGVSIL